MLYERLQPADPQLGFRHDFSRPDALAARNPVFPKHSIDGISKGELTTFGFSEIVACAKAFAKFAKASAFFIFRKVTQNLRECR